MIYEENHSFDNLYGGWGTVNGQRVNGRSHATAARTTQVDQDGTAYSCLLQNDVNLTSPPQPADCTDTRPRRHQPLHQQAVRDRPLHQADRHHLPGARRVRRQRRAEGER